MNIILGASGQVGSAITDFLLQKNLPVKGVIRDAEKADELEKRGAAVYIADYTDLSSLKTALNDGTTVFLLTPENVHSHDLLGDTKSMLENYRLAVESSPIEKIVGLSSIGAQHATGTGNLQMSYMLEHAFAGLPVQQVFIRPAYYYSNWLAYLSTAEKPGILPTFFPVDLKIPMISPIDVARFAADIISNDIEGKSKVYELTGPEMYSAGNVADIMEEALNRDVEPQQIPREHWEETLRQVGFSKDAVNNLIKMSEAVIDGRASPEGRGTDTIEMPTTLKQYLNKAIYN